MMRRPLAPGIVLALLLLMAPFAAGQDAAPPEGAQFVDGGAVRIAHWIGSATEANATIDANESATLWFAVQPLANETATPAGDGTGDASGENATADAPANGTESAPNATVSLVAVVNVSAIDGLAFEPATLTIPVPANATEWTFANATLSTVDGATGGLSYRFTVTLHEGDADGPVVETFDGAGAVTVFAAPVPQPPADGIPDPLLIGLLALVVVGAGGGAYLIKQRRERARLARAPRRSQALREAQLEQRLERAQAKERTEEAQQIQQEIRQQEKVREGRRELQILEAKRADAMKTLDLLRKRHEAGGLTKLQYESMVAKKQADLERIEREIAEMESEGGGPGAAA